MRFLFCLLLPISLWPQSVPSLPLRLIREYLSLTPAQEFAMLANIAEQTRTDLARQRRISQLRSEILQETAAASPDPVGIGTRQVEIELTCRVIDLDAVSLAARNGALLTDPQKAKLKTLEDAMKLAGTVSDAQRLKLLPGSPSLADVIPTTRISPVSGGILSNLTGSSSCAAGQFP